MNFEHVLDKIDKRQELQALLSTNIFAFKTMEDRIKLCQRVTQLSDDLINMSAEDIEKMYYKRINEIYSANIQAMVAQESNDMGTVN